MKKHLIIGALLLLSATSFTQIVPPQYIYCELMGINRGLLGKVNVNFRLPENKAVLGDSKIYNESIVFNTISDALMFAEERGWEMVAPLAVRNEIIFDYHFIMRRRLTEDEKSRYVPIKTKN